MNGHRHNDQVRLYGRCETCALAPHVEAARKQADPAHNHPDVGHPDLVPWAERGG